MKSDRKADDKDKGSDTAYARASARRTRSIRGKSGRWSSKQVKHLLSRREWSRAIHPKKLLKYHSKQRTWMSDNHNPEHHSRARTRSTKCWEDCSRGDRKTDATRKKMNICIKNNHASNNISRLRPTCICSSTCIIFIFRLPNLNILARVRRIYSDKNKPR